ncbi:alpha/beta hydrolase [Flagellimonas aquimarina]|uniref:Alpha/beta hydrolase n=1 Tax=Flagellimonas aquimarina TaxID=2201895 RepID=A0A316KZ24_9FLAO|nr:alpha/beta hydrolase [Allomuricauda koreensis]PWL39517.1 alpha/beta hydrolase [Allomuricauda koreensis]
MNESYHPFKSEKAKEKYLAFNDKHAKLWPVPSKNKCIETSNGKTFVRISGAEDKPPLILLPGDTENSLSWMPQIKDFSEHYQTYALDNIYDNGRSIYYRPLKKPRDFVHWLNEVFDALNLKNNINLLGFSYGGWITSIYTLAHPERLNKTILISPSSTVFQPRIRYLIPAIFVHFFPFHFFVKKLVYWERKCLVKQGELGRAIADQMTEDIVLAGRCFKKGKFIDPTVLSDHDLQNLKVPIMYLIGEKEVLYPADKVVKRLNDIAPQIKTIIVPDASHDITHSRAELVNRKVLDFLQEQ